MPERRLLRTQPCDDGGHRWVHVAQRRHRDFVGRYPYEGGGYVRTVDYYRCAVCRQRVLRFMEPADMDMLTHRSEPTFTKWREIEEPV
jgi:hypothetical protein